MQHVNTASNRARFDVLIGTRGAQAAMMTLGPGCASNDEPGNEHPASQQWLFVISGSGEAVAGRRRSALRSVKLRKNSLLLIEKGELHQIRNTGTRPLVTINFYIPPAYDSHGEPKSAPAK